jgi:hypothetical protein
MTTPPLCAFRTTPRDPRSAELSVSHLGTALTAEGFLDTDGDLISTEESLGGSVLTV